MAQVKIEFNNGLVVVLTPGEMTAIERMARMNGTDPAKIQYDPGFIQWRTLRNLARKGVICREGNGCYHFIAGLLPVLPVTINSASPFVLLDHVTVG